MAMTKEQKREAWSFAQGMIKVSMALNTSNEMNALIEREIAGGNTTADIKKELDAKYLVNILMRSSVRWDFSYT